jgi:hypothetical protein
MPSARETLAALESGTDRMNAERGRLVALLEELEEDERDAREAFQLASPGQRSGQVGGEVEKVARKAEQTRRSIAALELDLRAAGAAKERARVDADAEEQAERAAVARRYVKATAAAWQAFDAKYGELAEAWEAFVAAVNELAPFGDAFGPGEITPSPIPVDLERGLALCRRSREIAPSRKNLPAAKQAEQATPSERQAQGPGAEDPQAGKAPAAAPQEVA